MTKDAAEAKAIEVSEATEIRGALWKQIYAAPLPNSSNWDVFGETQIGLRYRWNEADQKFYYWGA